MNLSRFCVDRPVFTVVINFLVILLGLVGLQSLPVRQLPRVESPVISVTTVYLGAAPALVEQQVTTPLEEQLGGIDGLRFMTSASTTGSSKITLTFDLSIDLNDAADEVRARVDRAVNLLPDAADTPLIAKSDPDAQPFLYIGFTSERMNSVAITDYLKRFLVNGFRAIDGVGRVAVFGGRDYEMNIAVDPEELAAQGITATDLVAALTARNVTVPAGGIETDVRRYGLRTDFALRTVEEFNDLVLKSDGLNLVRLRDIGSAELGGTEEQSLMRVNRAPAVGLGLIRSATANPLDVARDARAMIDRIAPTLPPGMKAEVVFDGSVFIEKSIEEVYNTLGEAFVLVLLVVILFLGSLRSAFVPLIAIPISIIGVLAVMAAFGYSLNTLTLLALVMAIGLVVDDGIVVVENIQRHVEDGLPPKDAAKTGMREITFVVIATTITLAAVFVPVGVMPGVVGQFFKEFAFTLAGAVVVSGFVALTLSPMLSARVLRKGGKGRFERIVDTALGRLSAGYRRALDISLKARLAVVVLGLAVAAGGYAVFTQIKTELVPLEDRGYLLIVSQGPTDANLAYTDKYAARIEDIVATKTPALEAQIALPGMPSMNQSLGLVTLKPWDQRPEVSVQAVQRALWPELAGLPGVQAFPIVPASFGSGATQQPVSVAVQTTQDYTQLNDLMSSLRVKAAALPQLRNVRVDLRLDSLAFQIRVDRETTAALGITEAEIGTALGALFGGSKAGSFQHNGKDFDVRIRLDASRRSGPHDVDQIYLTGQNGDMIPLAAVVSVENQTVPASLAHHNQLRSATLSASLADGVSLGDGLKALTDILQKELPAGTSYAFTGQSLEFQESQGGTAQVFGLALLVVFLVLAAQFESVRDPFVILLTVPLAVTGALGGLLLTGHTSNVYSMIGIITLIGLITKQGILICEFANQLQERGLERTEAVARAAELRLRPILMTTAAMVFGILPLAVASGPGAVSRQSIGVSVIGGLVVGTLLTLFVVPAVYSLIARKVTPAAAPEAEASPTT